MNKLFNIICICAGVIGGIVAKLLGEWDILLSTLCIFMIFDYITGLLKGYFEKNIDSNIGFWGIVKKFVILIIVSTAHLISQNLGADIPLREMVIVFFLSNEGISILENASVFIPIPENLKNALAHLRDTSKNNNDKNEE